MSAVVDLPRERIYCLESALKIDPTNRAAMRGLAILGARRPAENELPAPVRLPNRTFDLPSAPLEPQVEAEKKPDAVPAVGTSKPAASPFKSKKGSRLSNALGVVVFAAFGIGIIAVGGYFLLPSLQPRFLGSASTLPPPSPTATDTPLPGTPTATPIPAATRIIRTPIPTEFIQTPLALFISSSPTPTPLAGYTPHPSYEAYQAGINALERGDYEDAIGFFDQVISLTTQLPDVYYFLGEAQRLSGAIGTAIGTYDKAANLDPNYAPTYLGRGRALLERNEDAALQDFNRAIKADPGFTEAYEELARYNQANSLWQRQATQLEAALAAGVRTPRLLIYLSEAYLNLARYQSALNYALEGSADDPAMLDGYLAVGRSYVALGVNVLDPSYFTTAIWPLQTYTAYAPQNERGWGALGRALVGTGNLDQGLEVLNIALEINPRYAPAYLARAILHAQRGEFVQARADVFDAQRFGPETFDLRITTARILINTTELQLALKDYLTPAIAEAKNIENVLVKERELGELYALRGIIYESNQDNLGDAIIQWNWVLSLENALPETRALAQVHVDELSGVGPTRTVTPSRTPTLASISSATPTASPTQ
jgi:tetratricopeptide (TPR) repeat protein